MIREKLPPAEFSVVLTYGLERLSIPTGGGGYKSYFAYQEGDTWIAGYREYIFAADGFPYDTVEYEVDWGN